MKTRLKKKEAEPGKPGLSSTPEQLVSNGGYYITLCSPKDDWMSQCVNLCTFWSKVQKGSSESVLIDHGSDGFFSSPRAMTRVTATCVLFANSPTCLHLFLYCHVKIHIHVKTYCTEVLLNNVSLLPILAPIETHLFDNGNYFHSRIYIFWVFFVPNDKHLP